MFTTSESVGMDPHKLRYFIAGILILGNLLLLSVVVYAVHAHAASKNAADTTVDAGPPPTTGSDMLGGSNVVTVGLGNMVDAFNARVSATNQSVGDSVSHVGTTVGNGGKAIGDGTYVSFAFMGRAVGGSASFVGHAVGGTATFMAHGVGKSGSFVGRGIASSVLFTGRTIGSGFAFMLRLPSFILSPISHTKLVSSVLRPGDSAKAKTPVIDDNPAEVYAELAAVTPAVKTAVRQIPAPSTTPAPGPALLRSIRSGRASWSRPFLAAVSAITL